jgi:hypothetical protein
MDGSWNQYSLIVFVVHKLLESFPDIFGWLICMSKDVLGCVLQAAGMSVHETVTNNCHLCVAFSLCNEQ